MSGGEMPRLDDTQIKTAVADLANALQTAILLSARLHERLVGQDIRDDAATLHLAIQRATLTLKGLQPLDRAV